MSELERYSVVEAATGIGRTVDVTISANEDGTRVSASDIYTTWLPAVGHAFPTQTMKHPTSALASRGALQTLGFERDTGVVRVVPEGEDIVIRGPIELPDSLDFLANSVIIPHNADESAPISSLVITTARAEDVPLVLKIVSSYLTGHSPDDYSLESSTDLVNVREAVKGELTRNNYVSVLISVGVAAALAMTLVWAVALLKRRDFGRRRALGASRRMIIGLVTGQMLLIATVGSISGTAIGVLALAFLKAPYPTIRFSLALIIAMTVLSTLASIVPALWAGNRDPLTELRVP
ncbi:ABC transporter permease [Actinomyces urinae]|uniref:ABC transporter permease n=1 Tax=Actinomyces urinae TaxID=1689268 RepID=UPI001E2AB541|nr:FtsX-like permease family protein [Actinomyces urinae]